MDFSNVELRPDPTPILTLPPDEPEPELTEAELELKLKKEKAQRCKVIALNRMGHHPINAVVSQFNQKSKLKLLEIVRELFELPDDEISKEFNEVCIEVIFDEKEDYTQYPVYKKNYKVTDAAKPVVDLAGNDVNPKQD